MPIFGHTFFGSSSRDSPFDEISESQMVQLLNRNVRFQESFTKINRKLVSLQHSLCAMVDDKFHGRHPLLTLLLSCWDVGHLLFMFLRVQVLLYNELPGIIKGGGQP